MSEFTAAQKGVMPLVIPLIWVVGYIHYRVSIKPMPEHEDEYSRWGVWYWVVGACVIGKTLFHSIPNATLHTVVGPEEYAAEGLLTFSVFLGLCIMVMYQEIGRVWHENIYYSTPSNVQPQEDMLNRETRMKQRNVEIDNLSDFGEQYSTGVDKNKDQTRRTWIARILLLCMFYSAAVEGIFTCYWQDKTPAGIWTLVFMSWIMRILDSIIIYGAMVHGMFVNETITRWWELFSCYGAISLYWGITVLLSMVPVFTNMMPDAAEDVISRWYFVLFTGITAGVFIWFWAYFILMQPRNTTKRYTKSRLFAFVFFGALSGVTALFV